jgi:uncharacterized OsmC-like protein
MASPAELKQMYGEAVEALKHDPSIGRGTATTTVRVREGFTCDIVDGPWKLVADEMPGDGGAGLGPDSGVFGRAALGSCLAIGYVGWAAMLDVPLTKVEVVVEADYDAAAMLGIDDATPPGWGAMRYQVVIESPAPAVKVQELVEKADRYSSLLDCFRRALPIERDLKITTTEPEQSATA